jgi:cardiolipin synthase
MIYIPNLLTLIRIGLVPWIVVLLQQQEFGFALGVFIIAGLTDGLDGYIAKRFNAQTFLGAILDPIADKALLVSTYIMLSVMELIPFWLVVAVVFRDLVIVGGYLLMLMFFESVKIAPLLISKVNTFLQIAYIVVVLGALAWPLDLSLFLPVLNYSVLAACILSGLAYVFMGSMKVTNSSSDPTLRKQ